MYSDLDSPPPRSILLPSGSDRRPWSPGNYDYLPSSLGSSSKPNSSNAYSIRQRERQRDSYFGSRLAVQEYPPLPGDQFPVVRSKPKREASEASVEALDLADYAKTLRARQAEDPYPAFPFAGASLNSSANRVGRNAPRHEYPPSSYPAPISRGGTRSSTNTSTTATHQTPRSNVTVPQTSTYGRRPRRPYSLPNSVNGSTPQVNRRPPDPDDEIDISQFPAWSRNWYHTNNSSRRNPRNDVDSLEAYEREAGLALPDPLLADSASKRGSSRNGHDPSSMAKRPPLDPFDPGYVHPQSYPRQSFDDFSPYSAAPSYHNHDPLLGDSREGIVPWSYDPPEYGQPPLDPEVKEKRMRMLEKAFGTDTKKDRSQPKRDNGKGKERDDGLMRDDDGKLMVGTPDGKGGLVTQGPRLRAAVRFLQILLVVAVGGPVIWAGIKLKPNPAPPPAGKPPLYVLYVLAPLTLLLLLYLFVIRPCTLRRRYSASKYTQPGAAQGMMVLPVAAAGGKGGKKGGPMKFSGGKKNKKGKHGPGMGGDVQVNLILPRSAFNFSSPFSQHTTLSTTLRQPSMIPPVLFFIDMHSGSTTGSSRLLDLVLNHPPVFLCSIADRTGQERRTKPDIHSRRVPAREEGGVTLDRVGEA
ncbi:hypothetical protein NMY22_g8274 [Coprinellus aureogranulatus]|nr:hypothetical protein NMY22_g8274 [Coprinellus aureogranulatus]